MQYRRFKRAADFVAVTLLLDFTIQRSIPALNHFARMDADLTYQQGILQLHFQFKKVSVPHSFVLAHAHAHDRDRSTDKCLDLLPKVISPRSDLAALARLPCLGRPLSFCLGSMVWNMRGAGRGMTLLLFVRLDGHLELTLGEIG